ncbi:2OG-FeII_Oxy domain-containing protein/DIOX_N domain-containing protein [Cephalotus follicularis]|uniref:2OG-FeII_Oxy domain-containing protein/DIOX_N domain-containing protein n=1 Tax=Cephalotus follicularis TaxID=3775 RepID=A0A1Q3B4L9_CEPFO|nr:2OG-FeII_Oxy domain-containing protein/DIOX_N domain-containing protein [Cephalotus follicularis]
MSPAMTITTEDIKTKLEAIQERQYRNGVKHLCENGISKIPTKYVLPESDRPGSYKGKPNVGNVNLKLPVIDFAELQGPNRSQVLQSLAIACEQYGFFQVVNHGIPIEVTSDMIDTSTRFFELPFEERSKYMSSDMKSPVRYGTSFNQNVDKVYCWRDFLKLICNPITDVVHHWPSSPMDFRTLAATYAKDTKYLSLMLTEAILESLGLCGTTKNKIPEDDEIMKLFEDGSHLMVVNCYPPCPEPDLTLGMPPHSDYGFLTLLLQDEVEGLQIQYQDKWVTVEPITNSFVVNVGDHLEIFSNGRYKSVVHRVLVNSAKHRISVASLHSIPFKCTVSPSPKLVDEDNPRRYKDADFASFLEYISSCEHKRKNFLESRKLT